ncbi:hypothetical protein [Streptomyces sp. NPDC019937]|uniref:hypothetical protein n=1 Tax=Streptomyces sp. NPDC019937 TaxID=3154787 RepID=UPI0033DD0527
MAADLMGINVVQGGAVALLAVAVLMVLTGRLIPRRTYDDLKEERDTWRNAALESEKGRAEDRAQVGELLETTRTTGHVLASLPLPGDQGEVPARDPLDETSAPRP